jgi:hypothetical protein
MTALSLENVLWLALLQGSMGIQELHMDSLIQESPRLLQVEVLLTSEWSEAPVS